MNLDSQALDAAERAVHLADAQRLYDQITSLLAEQTSSIAIGAALCHLMSMWIAGHYQNGPGYIQFLLDSQAKVLAGLVPEHIKAIKARFEQ